MGLFDGGAKDRAMLHETLSRLGPTRVDRLSEALGWPSHRTVRTLKALSDGTRYDPTTGSVAPPTGGAAVRPATPSPAPAPPARQPEPTAAGTCRECHGRMTTTGHAGTSFCPHCGYLEDRTTLAGASSRAAPTAPRPPGSLEPRQVEELVAAWVTARPILCPNCRQVLHHLGVESYACPACGERVTFSDSGVASVTRAPA